MTSKMVERDDVERLVQSELSLIDEAPLRETLRAYVVMPMREMRRWDYGTEGQRFPCWIVASLTEHGVGLAYCENGFGPAYPWGIVSLGDDALGNDAVWHVSLEHAFRNSPRWSGRNPPDYEIP